MTKYQCPKCGFTSDKPGICPDPWCDSNYWVGPQWDQELVTDHPTPNEEADGE